LPPDLRLRIRTDVAAAKVIDGEAVIINVVTGRYYSLEAAGALAWTVLTERPSTLAEIAARLTRHYAVTPETALADLERLTAELIGEDLVTTAPDENGATPHPAAPSDEGSGEGLAYTRPELAIFSDMEDLLAFDPPLPGGAPDVWQPPPTRDPA
jgi:hypothetical protein